MNQRSPDPFFHSSIQHRMGLLVCILLLPFLVSGQDAEPDIARQFYTRHINPDDLIQNGRAYSFYYSNALGNQYVFTSGLSTSRIVIDGILYEDIPLNYDILNDFVVTSKNIDGQPGFVILNKERISEFYVKDLHFVYIRDSVFKGVEAGIYQLAFDGVRSKLLIRKKKELVKDLQRMAEGKYEKFVAHDTYYLIKENEAIRFSNKKTFLACFENPELLKSFIKRNKIYLRPKKPSFVSGLTRILTYTEGG